MANLWSSAAAAKTTRLKRPLSTSFAWLYLGRQKLKLSPFISLLRQELAKRLLANASQKSLLKLTKKNSRTAAKYLDHIWMQYGIQSLQLPLATFQKVIMQHRTSINFLLRPFLKSRHTSRNLGKIMEHSIKQALMPERLFNKRNWPCLKNHNCSLERNYYKSTRVKKNVLILEERTRWYVTCKTLPQNSIKRLLIIGMDTSSLKLIL